MPVMNFDLEDGLPPVSFSINGEGAQRFMNFMAECTATLNSSTNDTQGAALTDSQLNTLRLAAEMLEGNDCEDIAGEVRAIIRSTDQIRKAMP